MTDISSILGNTGGMEEAKDQLGGGGYVKESGIYKMGIVHAYIITSAKGSIGVSLTMKHADDAKTEFNTKIYMTGGTAKGQNPYYEKNGKKFPLPGFTTMDDIVRIVSDGAHGIGDAPRSTKSIEIYDFNAGGKVAQNVEVIDCLTQKVLNVGLQKKIVNKFQDGAPTAETTEKNEISLVMDKERRTLREKKANSSPEFATQWEEKYKDVTLDETTVKPGEGSSFGAGDNAKAEIDPVSADDTDGLFS